jgi:SagB-type dehydrogenase family enzyme
VPAHRLALALGERDARLALDPGNGLLGIDCRPRQRTGPEPSQATGDGLLGPMQPGEKDAGPLVDGIGDHLSVLQLHLQRPLDDRGGHLDQSATLPARIYRYDPRRHQLAPRASGDRRPGLAAAALHQTWIADAPAVVVIAAAYRRTSSKYGERGERYVHIEAGHAAENVCLQAVALSLGTTVVGAFSDAEVKRLLGLGEKEPLLLIPVGKLG